MTDILCNWLNDELKLSKRITTLSFAKDFSSGYLIGEVLHKSGLQDDFDQFSVAMSMDARLNNFTRVEPVLHLLGIPFDTNTARDVMTEISGVATRLLYQMFIALKQKQKSNLTGTAMETMRPAGPVKLEAVGSEMYKERLRHLTPRQTDLDLDVLSQKFYQHRLEMEATAFKERFEEQEKIRKRHEDERNQLMERSRVAKQKQTELLAKIEAATVEIPRPPAHKTAAALARRREVRVAREAQETMTSIWEFEERLKASMPQSQDDDSQQQSDLPPGAIPEEGSVPAPVSRKKAEEDIELIRPRTNSEYTGKIRKRLQEDSAARTEREKRRRKVLVDQLKAHEKMEESRREEVLVNRLMRQSQLERRIAVQLMQTRREKDVIKNNRRMREEEYEQRRKNDFQDALDREAEMARLLKFEYAEQTMKDKELHERIAAERALARYQKHYSECGEILDSVLDFSNKVAEYRELTEGLVPAKLYREWTELFVSGQPLYEVQADAQTHEEDLTPQLVLEEERQQLLDEADFAEYKSMIGEWVPPEESGIPGPPRPNPVVGHIVQRLYDIVYPPTPPPTPPQYPPFPIKACVVGKFFSGKSTCCKQLLKNRRVEILSSDVLLNEAIEAAKNNEEAPEPEPEPIPEEPTPEVPVEVPPTEAPPTGEAPPSAAPGATPTEDSNKAEEVVATPQEAKPEEGMEKTDPEKPVEAESPDLSVKSARSSNRSRSQLTTAKSAASVKPTLTVRAQLGGKAMKLLKKGKPVDDQILVEIIAEAIRQVPEGTGWILDGFPTTYAQSKLLEKALSGFDQDAVDAQEKANKKSGGGGGKKKGSKIAPDPRPPPPAPEPVSGINVVILVDTPDELCLKRSAGRYDGVQAGETYHQEFKPPPEGSATGVEKQEKVIPAKDVAHDQEQVQHRLTGFQDAWSKMEKWFSRFGILRTVDGSLEEEPLYLEVEKILDDTMDKLQGKPEEESCPVEVSEETAVPEEPPAPEPEPTPAPEETLPEPPKEEEGKRSRPSSKKSRSGSAKRSDSAGSGKGKKSGSQSPKRGSSGKKSGKGSRGSSPSSKKGKKKSPEPEPEPEVPETPPGPPPPEPGSEEWEFVDLPIDVELAKVLAPYWDGIEEVYVDTSKHSFRCLRTEREAIIRYFYQIRQDFLAYLRRPDHKNEFVAQWQQDYNAVADDMREDEETRAELHDRVDDLRERLWSICDERKQQAEDERAAVMADGWLDDRLGVLSNYYISIMQVEVDRLQDTMRMLKDYYKGMEGQIPDENREEFARIPLIELPPDVPEPAPEEGDQGEPPSGKDTPARNQSAKSGSASGKKSRQKEVEEDDSQEKKRIPLVPRRPTSADIAAKEKKDKKPVKKDRQSAGAELESPPPPQDPDERLVFDALWTGLHAIQAMMTAELMAREAEEEAERKEEEEKQKKDSKAAADKGKKGGKKSGKKSRSPSPKKGKKEAAEPAEAAPPPEEETESEEEKEKKRIKQKAKEELFFAMQEEVEACKTRMMLINQIAASVLQELKARGDATYNDMNDWLGARFLKEMESIDQLSELMRSYIEKGEKISHELVLLQDDFLVADDIKVVRTPTPPPILPPRERTMADMFTVNQLYTMYKQFTVIAPDGNMSIKGFIDSVQDLVNLTQGEELIPEAWSNVSTNQLSEMATSLSSDGVYVDWKSFLLAVSQPLPRPSQSDLLRALQAYSDLDQEQTGRIDLEQFMQTDLWFSTATPPGTPVNMQESGPYNRPRALKRAYFDFFADHSTDPPTLDYTDMLLYFAAAPDGFEGFLRALSVSTGTHMPRTHTIKDDQLVPSALDIAQAPPTPQPEQTPATPAQTPGSAPSPAPSPAPEATAAPPRGAEDIPPEAVEAEVHIDTLLRVLRHGERTHGDSHRFSQTRDPEDALSRDRLMGVYQDLAGGEETDIIKFKVLVEHPTIQDILTNFNRFKAPDLRSLLTNQPPSADLDTLSAKTPE